MSWAATVVGAALTEGADDPFEDLWSIHWRSTHVPDVQLLLVAKWGDPAIVLHQCHLCTLVYSEPDHLDEW